MHSNLEQQALQLSDQIDLLYKQGRYKEALPLAIQLHDLITQHLGGKQHPGYGVSLNFLALLYLALGNYDKAESLSRQLPEILGKDHPKYADALNNLALIYQAKGNYEAAASLQQQAQQKQQETLPENHPDYAFSLQNQARLLRQKGDYKAAEPLYRRSLEIFRKTIQENHSQVAQALGNLAGLYYEMGKYTDAEQLYLQALEIQRQYRGEDHTDFATSLVGLAALYQARGNFIAAESPLRRSLTIYRQTLGEDHPYIATTLNNLAQLYQEMGDYTAAEPLFRQTVEIFRRTNRENYREFGTCLNNLAQLYQAMGNYAAAAPLYEQAKELLRQALGENHREFAGCLNNQAALYYAMGSYTDAERLYQRVVEIQGQEDLEKNNLAYATSLSNLGTLYQIMGNYTAAEPLLLQGMEISRTLGEKHPSFATSLNNLAILYKAKGNHLAAEPLLQQTMEIRRTAEGENHPKFAESLNNLAQLYKEMGNYAVAEFPFRQALKIFREIFGENHPNIVTSLSNLATLCVATNRKPEALALLEQATSIDDRIIGQVFSIGSESQRMAYLQQIRFDLMGFLSLVSQHLSNSPTAIQAAFDLILRRKSIGAEALAAQRDAVFKGRYPHLVPRLRHLNALRMQIAQKTLAGPGSEGLPAHQQLLEQWNSQKNRLEASLAQEIPEMNIEQQLGRVNRQEIAQSLPAETILVEFVRFNVFNFNAVPAQGEPQWKAAHYFAFVLVAGEPDNVQMIDLGEAELIDKTIAQFRISITGENENRNLESDTGKTESRNLKLDPKFIPKTKDNVGVDLRVAVFDKLLSAVGERKRLFLAPDGDLTRLPFEVLPLEGDRRLIDEYYISYLSTGRDVLRFGVASTGKATNPLVAADPDFDLRGTEVEALQENSLLQGRQSRDLERNIQNFKRLQGTRVEGEQVATLLNVQPLLQGKVLESQIKSCCSPRILHLATHGFFLPNQQSELNKLQLGLGAMNLMADSWGGRLSGQGLENPLLRSGLALAGANTWLKNDPLPIEAEDGILTAEDVSGLDLLSTELVVLSACETGLGEVWTGEGVFGLRRAFVLAGAKTLVMSLWKVPDRQTQELMEDFYRRILDGQPRFNALREAQLAMKTKYPNPFYWGAFICQGNPNPLLRER